MEKIGVILPYNKLYYQTLSVKEEMKELKNDIDVRIGLLSNAVDVAKDLIIGGAQVLVSRGGTVKYISQEFPDVPLVEIEISSYDIAEALKKAKKISNCIALIIFKNMLFEGRDLSKLFDVDMKIFYIEKEEDAAGAVKQAVDQGYDVVVGGGVANKICNQMGVHSVLISSGKDSIFRAIRQAQSILRYRNDVLKQTRLIETVIENTPLGILTSDINGKIKMVNSPALNTIGMSREFIIGKHIQHILPEAESSNNFIKEFEQNKVMVNIHHIDIASSNIGYIITLEEISEISKKEKYIRSTFVKKGHVARFNFNNIIGESTAIKDSIQMAKRYAGFDSTVLIFGETGTGKEMFAQSIHNASKRANGPFVAVNCASLSETLMESELFGYVEGAFTGASKQGKAGLFEMAHRGTIFLDEISEMPLSIQSKLLRVLQEKVAMRLGDDRVIPVDVRVIAASNKNLYDMVKNGQFRKDLYYRLNVLTLKIPPLRDRQQDILRLFEHFLEIYCIKFNIKQPIIAQEVYQVLLNYQWPGNVREVENFTERLLAAYGSSYISVEQIRHILDLEEPHDFQECSGHTEESLDPKTLDKKTLFRILKANNFNKTRTAKQLGIGRTTLWRMLKKMNISNESSN